MLRPNMTTGKLASRKMCLCSAVISEALALMIGRENTLKSQLISPILSDDADQYTNGLPHIGHHVFTIVCDTSALQTMRGYGDHDHGTDEHGSTSNAPRRRPACPKPNLSQDGRDGSTLGELDSGRTSLSHHRPELRTRLQCFSSCARKWFRYPGLHWAICITTCIVDVKGRRKLSRLRRTRKPSPNQLFLQLSAFQKPLLDW